MRINSFTLILCFILVGNLKAQYLDMVRLNTGMANFEDVDGTFDTNATNVNFEFLYPTILRKGNIFVSGLTVENTNLQFAANTSYDNITMTRLNLGFKLKHGEDWTGTYVVLPKLATNFHGLDDAFQLGALALLEHKKSDNFIKKFGLYSSSENFGTVLTPLIGFYYKSANEKLFIDATLPIRAEIDYTLSEKFSVGADLRTSIKSYALGNSDAYVQEESIRAATYISYKMMQGMLLVRGKVGFDTTDYGVYSQGDTVGVQVLTFPLSDDNRTRLNNEFNSVLFVGIDMIFRIPL